MRILSVQPGVPFGGVPSGLDLRNAAILKALRETGALSLFVLRGEKADAAPDWLQVRRPQRERQQNVWSARSLTRPLSYAFSLAEKQDFREAITGFKPDVAVVEGVLLRDAVPILQASGVPVVLDMHNIESDLLAALFRNRKWRVWPGNLLQEVIRSRMAKAEDKAAAQEADAVWVCSRAEQADLARRWGVAANVVPNPLPDTRLLELPIRPARYAAANLVFAGLLSYGPNSAAIKTLCHRVAGGLPGGARLEIAGRAGSAAQEKMITAAGAVLANAPDDMLPHMAAAGYSLMPITYGGGTRIKVLEALAAGVVVIASKKAVEGLALENGVHYRHAETPEAMLAHLAAAMAAPEQTAEIARQGRALVQARYGHDSIISAVRDGLQGLSKV